MACLVAAGLSFLGPGTVRAEDGASRATRRLALPAEGRVVDGVAYPAAYEVNLAGASDPGRLYLRLAAWCVDDAKAEKIMLPRTREAVMLFLRGKTPAEILPAKARARLGRELCDFLNKMTGGGGVVRVYFIDLVVY